MTKKEKIAVSIGFLMLLAIFISSSMTYHQQTIKQDIKPATGWLYDLVKSIHFTYAGQKHSVAIDGYGTFVELILRKLAHFGSYFVVGASFIYGFKSIIKKWYWEFFFVFFGTVGLAAFDEFHQAITGDRTPSIYDVMLDGFGAFCGIILMVIFVWIFGKIKKRS